MPRTKTSRCLAPIEPTSGPEPSPPPSDSQSAETPSYRRYQSALSVPRTKTSTLPGPQETAPGSELSPPRVDSHSDQPPEYQRCQSASCRGRRRPGVRARRADVGSRAQPASERFPVRPAVLVPLVPERVVLAAGEDVDPAGPPGDGAGVGGESAPERLPVRPTVLVPLVPDRGVGFLAEASRRPGPHDDGSGPELRLAPSGCVRGPGKKPPARSLIRSRRIGLSIRSAGSPGSDRTAARNERWTTSLVRRSTSLSASISSSGRSAVKVARVRPSSVVEIIEGAGSGCCPRMTRSGARRAARPRPRA